MEFTNTDLQVIYNNFKSVSESESGGTGDSELVEIHKVLTNYAEGDKYTYLHYNMILHVMNKLEKEMAIRFLEMSFNE